MRSIKFAKHKILLIPLSMLAITLIAGYFLSHIPLGANATTSDVSLHVADTCTMNGVINEGDEHTVSLINGQERTGIGITRLTTLCNDNNGYAIYAIGYSGTTSDPHNTAGELGRTDLVGLSTGLTISTADWADRNTGDNATKSIWSMSLQDNSEVISTMKPTIENGFSNYLAVPTTYTKVASFPAATGATLATASIVNTTYAAKVAAIQSSDTYVGQVKYTMVHPSSNSATGFTFDDAFQLAGKSRVSGTSYFAMQDMNAAICNKVTELNNNFPETELIDIRDNNVYTVKKINGLCWMTENLKFTGTTLDSTTSNVASNYTAENPYNISTINGSGNGYFSLDSSDASYTDHCDATNGNNYACIKDSGNDTTGIWYNYAAASAGTITTISNQTTTSSSVCPAGWHIPSGAAVNTSSEFYKLYQSTSTNEVTNAYLTVFNAVPGGYYRDGSLSNPEYGYWWSATAYDATYRYRLGYNSSNTQFDSGSGYRYRGFFVRCVSDMTMQGFTTEDAAFLATNESLQLRDVRDGKEYWVTKLADGNVWMTQNLDLDLDSTVALTNADTDLNSVTSWTPTRSTIDSTGYGNITTCSSQNSAGTGCWGQTNTNFASGWTNDNDTPYSDNPGYRYMTFTDRTATNPAWYSNGDTFANCSTQDTNCGGQGHYMIGNYYNFAAANATNSVAGTVGHTVTDSDADFVMPNSICPKGWRMPKGQSSNNDFTTLFTKYNIVGDGAMAFNYQGLNAVRRAPLYFFRSGFVNGSTLFSAGTRSYVWSSTVSAESYGHNLHFNGTGIDPANSDFRLLGFAVRCLLRTE